MSEPTISFEQTVRAMTAPQIIRAMVAGLRKKWVGIYMGTFGTFHRDACFGCAATNMICQIRGKAFEPHEIGEAYRRAEAVGADGIFLQHFEVAIDALRNARFAGYDSRMRSLGMPECALLGTAVYLKGIFPLPPGLGDDFTDKELREWETFADKIEQFNQ